MSFKLLVPTLLVGVVAMAATAGPAAAQVDNTNPILIPVPAGDPLVNPSGKFSAFDISFADPVLGDIFIADRSNAGVDIFSGSGLSLIGRAAGFAGVQPPPPPSRPQQQHFRPGWRSDGHLGRGHNSLRR
jgi:hypothetical protein